MATLSAAAVVIVLVLAFTRIGRDIDAATQRFMLYYAGVFALIGLTGSVLLGLLATDRIVMRPGHRVMAQAVHRAFSFGALAFLIIHIVTEILAQRAHVIDGVIPFLSPFRTFYIGLGTIASDLIVLIVVTSIIRKRFTAHGRAWRWRAIHYTSYVAFVFGVLHGLLGGRSAKPYVDWSYGFAIAVTALGLAIRFLATSLRPKEALSAPPGVDRATSPAASPMRAAALSMAQAQLGGTVQVLPAAAGARTGAGLGSWAALPAAQTWTGPIPAVPTPASRVSGPIPALPAPAPAPAGSGPFRAIEPAPAFAAKSSPDAYRDLGFTPLGAPPYGDDVPPRGRPYADTAPWTPPSTSASRSALAGPAAPAGQAGTRQPRYEPGYDGPPRFEGAPRRDVPQGESSSYPYGSRGPAPRGGTGPIPRVGTGPMPRAGNGQPPPTGTGPMRRAGTGPMPRAGTGPMPRAGTGPMPRADTGPMPRAGTAGSGPTPLQKPPADSPKGPRTGRGRRGTGRQPRGADPTSSRHRPDPARGDEQR
jgi:DMSO/TMAO reductase YedYZ heme-binding membrane subunit